MDYSPVGAASSLNRTVMKFGSISKRSWIGALRRRAIVTLISRCSFRRAFPKEKEHVEGFNPELPWVTEAAGEKRRAAGNPSDFETMFGHMYSKWIQSYRDLPVLINQWANVVRWEKRTLPFLAPASFMAEGHTAHETEAEAEGNHANARYLPAIRRGLSRDSGDQGAKTPSEKFAGAVDTFSIEAMMKDGRAVQAGTSHYMGTNFSQAFDIQYLNRENTLEYAHTRPPGASARVLSVP